MYNLETAKGKTIQRSKKLFLSTCGLEEWTVTHWALKSKEGESHGMTPSRESLINKKRTLEPKQPRIIADGVPIKNCSWTRCPNFLTTIVEGMNTNKIYFEPVYGNKM